MAYDDDVLVAHQMNGKPGGKAPTMRPSSLYLINHVPQPMTLPDGRPKGLQMVLEERGVNAHKFKEEEKNKVERLLVRLNSGLCSYPSPILNLTPIEQVWGRAKVYAQNHSSYSFQGLHNMVTPALESVSLEAIHKYFQKSRDYIQVKQSSHLYSISFFS